MTWLLARLALRERRISASRRAAVLVAGLELLGDLQEEAFLFFDVLQPLGELGPLGGRLGTALSCGIALWRAAARVTGVEGGLSLPAFTLARTFFRIRPSACTLVLHTSLNGLPVAFARHFTLARANGTADQRKGQYKRAQRAKALYPASDFPFFPSFPSVLSSHLASA